MWIKKVLCGAVLAVGIVGIAHTSAIARNDGITKARPAIAAFDEETVVGVSGVVVEVATSSAFNISGTTSIGFDYAIIQGTSTPHVTIGYQTSMNNASWTATTRAVVDATGTDYISTNTAVTVPPTEWIRWILQTELLNATDTKVSIWFKENK